MTISLSNSPGCAGAILRCRSVLFAMIILQIQVDRILTAPPERDAPVGRNRHRETALQVSGQRMKPETRQVHFARRRGAIERCVSCYASQAGARVRRPSPNTATSSCCGKSGSFDVRYCLTGDLSTNALQAAANKPSADLPAARIHCRKLAAAEQQQARVQPATAYDPLANSRRIGGEHHISRLRLVHATAVKIARGGCMEAEDSARRHADTLARHRHQHKRACRQAGTVDDDALT